MAHSARPLGKEELAMRAIERSARFRSGSEPITSYHRISPPRPHRQSFLSREAPKRTEQEPPSPRPFDLVEPRHTVRHSVRTEQQAGPISSIPKPRQVPTGRSASCSVPLIRQPLLSPSVPLVDLRTQRPPEPLRLTSPAPRAAHLRPSLNSLTTVPAQRVHTSLPRARAPVTAVSVKQVPTEAPFFPTTRPATPPPSPKASHSIRVVTSPRATYSPILKDEGSAGRGEVHSYGSTAVRIAVSKEASEILRSGGRRTVPVTSPAVTSQPPVSQQHPLRQSRMVSPPHQPPPPRDHNPPSRMGNTTLPPQSTMPPPPPTPPTPSPSLHGTAQGRTTPTLLSTSYNSKTLVQTPPSTSRISQPPVLTGSMWDGIDYKGSHSMPDTYEVTRTLDHSRQKEDLTHGTSSGLSDRGAVLYAMARQDDFGDDCIFDMVDDSIASPKGGALGSVASYLKSIVGKRRGVSPLHLALTPTVHCLYHNLLVAIAAHGDTALAAAPFDPMYQTAVQTAGIKIVPIQGEGDEGDAALKGCRRRGSKGSVMLLSNPTNPAGRVLSGDEMKHCLSWATRHGLHVVVDETLSQWLPATKKSRFTSAWDIALELGPSASDRVHVVVDCTSILPNACCLVSANPALIKVLHTLSPLPPTFEAPTAGAIIHRASERAHACEDSFGSFKGAMEDGGLQGVIPDSSTPFVWMDLEFALTPSPSWEAEGDFLRTLRDASIRAVPGRFCGAPRPGWYRLCHTAVPVEKHRTVAEQVMVSLPYRAKQRLRGTDSRHNTPTSKGLEGDIRPRARSPSGASSARTPSDRLHSAVRSPPTIQFTDPPPRRRPSCAEGASTVLSTSRCERETEREPSEERNQSAETSARSGESSGPVETSEDKGKMYPAVEMKGTEDEPPSQSPLEEGMEAGEKEESVGEEEEAKEPLPMEKGDEGTASQLSSPYTTDSDNTAPLDTPEEAE